MSVKRPWFGRVFLGTTIVCLLAGVTTVLVGDYRWLPAGLRVTLSEWTSGFGSRATCTPTGSDEPKRSRRSVEEVVTLEEIADQQEPDPNLVQAETPRKRERLPGFQTDEDDEQSESRSDMEAGAARHAGLAAEDETNDPDASPVLSPSGRRNLAQRRPARLLAPEPDDDPFDDSSKDASGGRPRVTTAAFEEQGGTGKGAGKSVSQSTGRKLNFDDATAGEDDAPALAAKTRTGTPPAPISDTPAPQHVSLMPLPEIEKLIAAGDYVPAQRELSKWYWRTPSMRKQLHKQLDDIAASLYFSPQPLFRDPYVIQPGDQLRVISQRYKVSWEYLAKLNRVDAKKIRTGQKLKVVEGPFSALVTLANHELIVHLNGSFVKSYRVGVGKEGASPIGTFTVKNKVVNPTYYGPDGLVIADDDPKNPLGERWIDIGDSFGIHGTIDPESIGRNESRGCVRMLNSDVEEVYDLLVIGSQVKIQK